ncbi:MAG: ABC transporter ATP-binding protein [Actinomycetota bacterium]|nr:ABC transporter ATP-binding protein [Actinomycetota bacterium]
MSAPGGLRVEGLAVRYGGNLAVSDVSLEAPLGQIVGLIGPNGAGKTTTFSGCTGLLRLAEGRVHLGDRDITDLPPQRRAQLGLGRTFQRMELFDSLTVTDNIALGREAGYAGSRPLAHLRARRREVAETREAVARSLAVCGIEHLADRPVISLSTGQRRLVELARAMAARTSVLLLDEPSSGLDHNETEAFGRILVSLAAEGVGILLVEHDMSLVMSICDHLYVLDFGRLIFDGTPAEVAASDVVRQAYLGGEIAALQEDPA